ncbi:MAG: F0F1 ATP synthase subunit B [Bacteroidota bacterium]|nr:F0F1 ATP synthase subunit B [Bacteroidota bacterium]
MSLITPDGGLLFWMVLIFGIVFFILAKWGFPVITGMVRKRTAHIQDSLKTARDAENRLGNLAQEQARMIEEARAEQTRILKEAAASRDLLIEEAKAQARDEASRLLEKAKTEIAAEKESAMRDIRKQVALLSVGITEKVLRKDLSETDPQLELLRKLSDEIAAKGLDRNLRN